MSLVAESSLLDHVGGWTERDYLELPDDRRIELLDGGLLVSPAEIVSPGSIAVDRAIKPQLYSAAGIKHYLRIELSDPGPSAVVYRLRRGRYVEVASSSPGQRLCLAEPFPVDLDLTEFATATRPLDSSRE